MGEKFSRRDFLKGMAVVTASGLLVACGGGNGTPVKLAFVAMDNFSMTRPKHRMVMFCARDFR